MSVSSVYVSPELQAFAKRVGISPVHLATAIAESDFTHLDHDDLAKLKASCTAPEPSRPDPISALLQV